MPDRFKPAQRRCSRLPRSSPGGSPAPSCATPTGIGPVYGGTTKFQDDPHWRDLILFYEYFHGDNGAGLGASHQTGWTGLIAPLLDLFARVDAKTRAGNGGRCVSASELVRQQVGGE